MTESRNEADRDNAGQPRSFFFSIRDVARRKFTPGWSTLFPVSLVLLAFWTIRSSLDVYEPPPPLQTFVGSSLKPDATVAVALKRKSLQEPQIRVNVTPGGVDSFQLEIRGRYRVVSLGAESKRQANFEQASFKVTSTKNGLKCGGRDYPYSQLEILPEQSPAVRVNGHLYRGLIRLYRRTDGKVSAVNVLPVEEYLASVVDSEMPAKFPAEARKAQAVVARTYALYQVQQADPQAVYDLLSSQRSQKYLGVEYLDAAGRRLAGESDSSRRATAFTRGIVCHSNGQLFCTYYSAVCGGKTVDGKLVFKDAIECLTPVTCEWCRESPHYRWTAQIDRDAFQKRALEPQSRGTLPVIRSIHQPVDVGTGAIPRFDLHHGTRVVTVTGIDLRERMPTGLLASPHFSMELEQDRVTFAGRGHGHGVGFCQWGAKGQADAGRSYDQIVRHYYPGAELVTLDY